ncbi:MAG: right-handed parallel beta-helix repeat-containing protein [Akkermansiaceae bacterium]|nr:right-handed parallel beta-helix repeat-containing protein [Akkermansiaceae bacterium]
MSDTSSRQLPIEVVRQKLGFEKDECLEDNLSKLRKMEIRLYWTSKSATSSTAKASFERDLAELRVLINAVEAELEKKEVAQSFPVQREVPPPTKVSKKWKGRFVIFTSIFGLLSGGGYFTYRGGFSELGNRPNDEVDLESLQEGFVVSIEKRRWNEAQNFVKLIKDAGATEVVIQESLAKIGKGRNEEKGQQIAFLISNAQSAQEAGQLPEAEIFCQEVENLQPGHPIVASIRESIRKSKLEVRRKLIVDEIEKAVASADWRIAKGKLATLRKADPTFDQIPSLEVILKTAHEEAIGRKKKAAGLVEKVKSLDKGTYSPQVMALLEEVVRLDPSEGNRALYKKMASYGKMVKVPEDHKTISAALKVAKKNDRVFVSKGIYHESLIMPHGVQIIGESRMDTIIECPADIGAVITVPADVNEVRVVSLTLRHSGLVNDDERSPVVAVDGGAIEGEDLSVIRASGHGIAVLNGGKASLSLCKISDSGWDGISVTGEGSSVDLSSVTCEKNLHHGVDFWDGASGSIKSSLLIANGRNGLFAIEPLAAISVQTTRSVKNREVGFYFSGANGVNIANCHVHENFLGGILFDQESKAVSLKGNQITKNGEAGLVFEMGVEVVREIENKVEENLGKQIWRGAVFPTSSGEDTVSPPPPPPPLKVEE